MSDERVMTYDEIETLAARALIASDVAPENAAAVAKSIAAAERDGQAIVGLSYLPTYCDHAACKKVDGHAQPRLEQLSPVALRVDAGTGFAHPAIALGLPALIDAARQSGIAALSVTNSYACGSLGYFVEDLAAEGLISLMTANASPSIAPFGGKTPFFGTNPLAFAVPRDGHAPLVIDQSSSPGLRSLTPTIAVCRCLTAGPSMRRACRPRMRPRRWRVVFCRSEATRVSGLH